MTEEIKVVRASEEALPWLVFKLHNLLYTVNSRIVQGILQYPDEITPIASAPEVFRGIINRNDSVLPLLDLRRLFSMTSTQEEAEVFISKANIMSTEVGKLFDSVNSLIASNDQAGDFFQFENTELEKWCYFAKRMRKDGSTKYENLPISIAGECEKLKNFAQITAFHISKKSVSLESIQNAPEYKEFKKRINDVTKEIATAVQDYKDSLREMIVIVSKGEVSLGLIVDEVVAVDSLDIISEEESFPKFQRDKFFNGVAHHPKTEGDILLLNEDKIVELINQIET